MVVKIPIRGRNGVLRGEAIVDDEDADLAEMRWFLIANLRDGLGYAARNEPTGLPRPRQRQVRMHRIILERMGYGDAEVCDHINHDPLDNRRSNLRPATPKINANNRSRKPTGRPITLPEPKPRPCQCCDTMFVPRRKSPGRIYCSAACQRRRALRYDDPSAQRDRSMRRFQKGGDAQ